MSEVEQTVRIERLLQARGVTLFALIDQSGEAEKAGLKMRRTRSHTQQTALPAMHIFKDEKKSTERVTSGRFEIERDGSVAYLEYTQSGTVLELIHTEVPKAMRGAGIAYELIQSALDWAREHKLKVDVICPVVAGYIRKHPQYSDLVLH